MSNHKHFTNFNLRWLVKEYLRAVAAAGLLIIIFYAETALAQPAILFERYYDAGGGNYSNNDFFYDIYALPDNGYIMCGKAFEFNEEEIWVVRIDENGQVIWANTYGSGSAYSIIQTEAGDFLVGCSNEEMFTALRLDPEGREIWRRQYEEGVCRAVIELKSDEFVLAGNIFFRQPTRGYIMMIDGDGEVLWANTYERNHDLIQEFTALRETEGGIVAGGNTQRGVWIVKVNFDGDVIWSQHHRVGMNTSPAKSMISSHDGGFLLCGYADYPYPNVNVGGGATGPFLLKIDDRGDREWAVAYNIEEHEICYGLVAVENTGYVLVGEHRPFNNGAEILVLRTSNDGLWHHRTIYDHGERWGFHDHNNCLYSVIIDNEGSIVAAGSVGRDSTNMDGIVMKLTPDFTPPWVILRIPQDTMMTVLSGDSVQFMVQVNDLPEEELSYRWFHDGVIVQNDVSSVSINFEDLGLNEVSCHLSDGASTMILMWYVVVTDLYIASHSPQETSLRVRRGTDVDFSVQARAVEGGQIHYLWELDGDEVGDDRPEYSHHFNEVQVEPYMLTATAYRGEASDTVMWEVYVRSAVWAWWPREFEVSVAEGDSLEFGVEPFDPESPNLAYRWYLDGEAWPDSAAGAGAEVALGWDDAGEHSVSVMVRDGEEADSLAWQVRVYDPAGVGGDDDGVVTPRTLSIAGVHPNPFNRSANVTIYLPTAGDISLGLYDIAGRLVRRLASGGYPAGRHRFAIADLQAAIPSGVYFVRLAAPDGVAARKVVMIR